MNEKDLKKTAFTAQSGEFEFNVMPFGLNNIVATFVDLWITSLQIVNEITLTSQKSVPWSVPSLS